MASSVHYPYLRQRAQRAWRSVRNREVKRALQALWNKGESKPSAEIEFGGGFPLQEIKQILAGKEYLADSELIWAVTRADRGRYERWDSGSHPSAGTMTGEDLALFEHIVEQYEELGRRFAPKP